nr:uncharacterized protein LOC116839226 [Chelonoidis abingdonii]
MGAIGGTGRSRRREAAGTGQGGHSGGYESGTVAARPLGARRGERSRSPRRERGLRGRARPGHCSPWAGSSDRGALSPGVSRPHQPPLAAAAATTCARHVERKRRQGRGRRTAEEEAAARYPNPAGRRREGQAEPRHYGGSAGTRLLPALAVRYRCGGREKGWGERGAATWELLQQRERQHRPPPGAQRASLRQRYPSLGRDALRLLCHLPPPSSGERLPRTELLPTPKFHPGYSKRFLQGDSARTLPAQGIKLFWADLLVRLSPAGGSRDSVGHIERPAGSGGERSTTTCHNNTSRPSIWLVCSLSLQKNLRRRQSAPLATSLPAKGGDSSSLLPLPEACLPCSQRTLDLGFWIERPDLRVPSFKDSQRSSRREWPASPSPVIQRENLLAWICLLATLPDEQPE